jgi:hypothetical protein
MFPNVKRHNGLRKTGRVGYLLTYLLTYSLHCAGYYLKSWVSLSLSKNILLSYGTRRFITVVTKARHWTLSWTRWIKESVQVRCALKHFVTIKNFYGEGFSAPLPTPKLDNPLSAVRDCLFNIFAATLRTRRTSLHPQPEDAPCRGDKGPT